MEYTHNRCGYHLIKHVMDGSPVMFLIHYVICIKEKLVVARFYCYGGLLIQILALKYW